MFARIGTRIALAQGLLIACFAAAGAAAFTVLAERGLDAEMTARSRAAARIASVSLDPGLIPPLRDGSIAARDVADERLSALAAAAEASRIVLLDAEGRVLATSDPRLVHGERHPGLALDAFEVARAREGEVAVSPPYAVGSTWFQAAWAPIGRGAVLGTETRVAYREPLRRLRQGVALFAAGGVCGAVGLGFLLARRVTGPLGRLSRAMAATGPSGLPRRAGVRGPDEVGQLGERFDALVDALERHDAELRALSATVAHEVRNPLGAMTGFADLIERRVAEPSVKPLVQGIREEIAALERLVSRFLSFAGDLRISRRCAGIGTVLEDALRAAVPVESAVRVAREFTVPGPEVDGDADALREVFVNLIRNAAEATGGRGNLAVGVREVDGHVEAFVRDDGPGIPEEIRPRLFQPFATTRAEGTGLGLAISRRIVAGHDGTLTCETGATGTTFQVRLPRAA